MIATPIGNLEDITLRALRLLKEVDLIACEDTRQTQKLLDHYGIRKPLASCHEHNEGTRAGELAAKLRNGANIALVTDAGTPLVSDPGYRIVSAAVDAGIPVVPIPGANAAITALSASGLPTDSFRFCGFLPPKSSQRRKLLERFRNETATLIFYETPHRILEALEDVAAVLPARRIVLGRELTKIHEEFLRGSAVELLALLRARPVVKGEMTLLIAKADAPEEPELPVRDEVTRLMAGGMSRMDAMKEVARARGVSKREIYRELESGGEE